MKKIETVAEAGLSPSGSRSRHLGPIGDRINVRLLGYARGLIGKLGIPLTGGVLCAF